MNEQKVRNQYKAAGSQYKADAKPTGDSPGADAGCGCVWGLISFTEEEFDLV